MRRNRAVIVLGILFGLSLGVVSYLYVILGIAFGIAGIEIMTHAWWIFAALAVISIVFSCFAKKIITLPRIGLTIAVVVSAIAHVFSLVQFVKMDALESSNIMLFVILFASLLLGFIAMILSYRAKSLKKV